MKKTLPSRTRARRRSQPPRSASAGAHGVGLLLVDAEGTVTAADEGAAELLSAKSGALPGTPLCDLVGLGNRGVARRRPDVASLAGRRVEVTLDDRGRKVAAELTVTALQGHGTAGYVARLHVVPARHRATRADEALTAAIGSLEGHAVAVADARGTLVRRAGGGEQEEEPMRAALRAAAAGRASTRRVDEDGCALDVRAAPIRDGGGAITGAVAVSSDATALRAAERRLAERDGTDEVTGLPKRAELERVLGDAVSSARQGAAVAVLCVGVGDLRLVNASLGFAAGDELLRGAAEALVAHAPDAYVARLASDQFAVVLTGLTGSGEREARAAAATLLAAFTGPATVAGVAVHRTARGGMALAPGDGDSAAELLAAAEAALGEAKRAGSRTVTLPPLGRVALREELDLRTRLREAVARGDLHLEYQPIFWLERPAPYGVEALLRWHDPVLGTVPPARFIPIAEEEGIIHELGRWVLGELCRQAQRWEAQGVFPQVHWNVSALELSQPSFAQGVLAALAEHALPPKRFTLEVTESIAVLDADRTAPVLHELHRAGLRIAIDDFGAGHSSLSRLQEVPAQVLKLDRALVKALPGNPRAAVIVTAALELAKALGMHAVAEGIETEGQRAFLAQRGCPLGQGYRLGRPRPAA